MKKKFIPPTLLFIILAIASTPIYYYRDDRYYRQEFDKEDILYWRLLEQGDPTSLMFADSIDNLRQKWLWKPDSLERSRE